MGNQGVFAFVNGQQSDSIALDDRGFIYGHGVFETMAFVDGRCPFWGYHLQRLNRGVACLAIPMDQDKLQDYWTMFVSRLPGDGVVKLIVTAGSGERGYHFDGSAENVNYLMQWLPVTEDYLQTNHLHQTQGVSVKVCDYRLPHNDRLAGIKHLNRLDQVLASNELNDGDYGEGLVLDDVSNLVEGISRNIFLRLGNCWYTPDLSGAGVDGVMRRYLIEHIFPELDEPLTIADIHLDQLVEVEEMLLCNSVSGIWPVISINRQQQLAVGHRTREIQQLVEKQVPCFANP